MPRLRWLLLWLVLPVTAQAESAYSVDRLQEGLTRYARLTPEANPSDLMEGSYAIGYVNAIAGVGQDNAFCPAQSVDNAGLARLVQAYIPTMAPWQHREEASAAVIGALRRAFPCPSKATPH